MSQLRKAWSRPRGLLVDVLPALLYVALLFWAGLIPLKSLPGPDFELADKVWHAAAFGGLALLLARVMLHAGRLPLRAASLGALIATALGGLLEVLQAFTHYRAAELADFVADALGAAIAYAALRALSVVPSAEERS